MDSKIISVRITSSMLKELKDITKQEYYMDVSDAVRSIVRDKWLENKTTSSNLSSSLDSASNASSNSKYENKHSDNENDHHSNHSNNVDHKNKKYLHHEV